MKNALMLQHDKIMLRKRSLIETVNDQLKNVCQIELDPPSMLTKLHHQSVIGFGCFLFLRQKTFHQHCRGVCTSLFPAGCLGRTRVLQERFSPFLRLQKSCKHFQIQIDLSIPSHQLEEEVFERHQPPKKTRGLPHPMWRQPPSVRGET